MSSDLCNMNPSQIVMYSTEYCADCYRAKAYFEANGIDFLLIGLEGNEAATEFVMNINHGFRSVPTIIFPDGSFLVEPNLAELKKKTNVE